MRILVWVKRTLPSGRIIVRQHADIYVVRRSISRGTGQVPNNPTHQRGGCAPFTFGRAESIELGERMMANAPRWRKRQIAESILFGG